MRLADAAIARLRPREREYTVWDNHFVGLGVRVRLTGGRSYVLLEDTGGRSRRVSLGPVSLKTVAEVRRECHARKAEPEATRAPRRVAPLFRDFIEGAWKEAHFGGYKPSTKKGVRSVLDRQLLPAFGAKPLDRIAPAGRAMVRPLQPDRSGQCQSRTRSSHADHQLRDRQRSPRNQPGAGREKEPETDAHALSVPRRGRSAPSRPGQADPRQQARAGGHHPAPASDRMPQERDPSAALVGSRSRQAGPRRQQDGAKDRSPQYPGPAYSRTPTARRKPLRLSVPERSRPAPQPQPPVLVPRPARGGHRGRSPSRSSAYPCQPRGDERGAGAGGFPTARPFRCAHDAALCPSGRPGNRGRGRAGRAIYRSGHGLVARKRSTAPIDVRRGSLAPIGTRTY